MCLLLKEHNSLLYKRYVRSPLCQRFEHHKSLGSQGGRKEGRNQGQKKIEASESSMSAVPKWTGTGSITNRNVLWEAHTQVGPSTLFIGASLLQEHPFYRSIPFTGASHGRPWGYRPPPPPFLLKVFLDRKYCTKLFFSQMRKQITLAIWRVTKETLLH